MYRQIEKEMRRAVRAGRLVLRTHVRQALKDENFEVADVVHCLMHGDIVADQYDPGEDDLKYEWRSRSPRWPRDSTHYEIYLYSQGLCDYGFLVGIERLLLSNGRTQTQQ